jgi:hypothetical protein
MRAEFFFHTKFNKRCSETGNLILRGELILVSNRKAYCKESKKYQEFLEAYNVKNYIDAQENAYFDNFCQNNNI